jgi:hypothetical protein
MATCPRCYGPLNDHHRCRPRWVKRAIFQLLITVLFALVGALVSVAFWPRHVPVLGLVIGGAIGYVVSLVIRD